MGRQCTVVHWSTTNGGVSSFFRAKKRLNIVNTLINRQLFGSQKVDAIGYEQSPRAIPTRGESLKHLKAQIAIAEMHVRSCTNYLRRDQKHDLVCRALPCRILQSST